MSSAAQRVFRLLGLHPRESFDNRVAAALADVPLSEAQDLLDELVDAHLVDEPDPGRFRFHDLMREYAQQLLVAVDPAPHRAAAVEQLVDHHLQVAATISAGIEPLSARLGVQLPPPGRPDLVQACLPEGIRWFDANRATLPALVRLAAAEGLLWHCWQLARSAWFYQYRGGHLDELIETHTVALGAAEQLDNPDAIATVRNYLSSAYFRLGRYREVIEIMEVALHLRQRLGDRNGEAAVRRNLGAAYAADRQFAPAMTHLDAALALVRQANQLMTIPAMLNNKALLLIFRGRYEEAQAISRRQLSVAREVGDIRMIYSAIGHLGVVRARLGGRQGALRFLRLALHFKRQESSRFGEGELLNEIGVLEREACRPVQAAVLHREALVAMTEVGDPIGQYASRNLLASALRDQGDVSSALDLHRRVLTDATRLGARYEQARALDGIARCLRDTERAAARSHWTRALALFRQVESPEGEEVARLLAEVD